MVLPHRLDPLLISLLKTSYLIGMQPCFMEKSFSAKVFTERGALRYLVVRSTSSPTEFALLVVLGQWKYPPQSEALLNRVRFPYLITPCIAMVSRAFLVELFADWVG